VLDDLRLETGTFGGVCSSTSITQDVKCPKCATPLDDMHKPLNCSSVIVPWTDMAFSGTASCNANVAGYSEDAVSSGEPGRSGSSSSDPEESPSASSDGRAQTEAKTCFSGDMTVRLDSGAIKRMDELVVGDVVEVGRQAFSRVFMFTHDEPNSLNTYIELTTASLHKVMVTPSHYMYVGNGALRAAGAIAAGDTVLLADGSVSLVVGVQLVRKAGGLYNPQTLHGDIVVNGILASTYTMAIPPVVAHAALSPLRLLYKTFGLYSNFFTSQTRVHSKLFLTRVS
jgi:Hint module